MATELDEARAVKLANEALAAVGEGHVEVHLILFWDASITYRCSSVAPELYEKQFHWHLITTL